MRVISVRYGLLLCSVAAALALSAAGQVTPVGSPDGMWLDLSDVDLDTIPAKSADADTFAKPNSFRAVWLDEGFLNNLLSFAPVEENGNRDRLARPAATIWLPMPDNTNVEFALVESPIMEPALEAKFPEIKTYVARSLDGRDMFARFDVTPRGFHAIVLGGRAVYIDPHSKEGVYLSYFADDYARDAETEGCQVEDVLDLDSAKASGLLLHGDTLRTYRLAVACTGEYANFHGASTPETQINAVAAIATTVNRVDAIYESEIAIRLMLVGTNDQIVYVNPATDPFSGNNNAMTLIGESQTVIDNVIGSANYDIGHTFAKSKIGGLAQKGVCSIGKKASGISGVSTPIGDPFDVEYVCHEIGHQFGADHTFNSKKGACKGNRAKKSAYERGSGTTILSYVGGCKGDNIESSATPEFHSENLRQIQDYVLTKTSCQTESSTGNTGPIVDAGADYTIPKQTPFTLTATGDDLEMDSLTYSWEERDKGPAQSVLDPDNGKSPLFRCYPQASSGMRDFPELAVIRGGDPNGDFFELLPSKARVMTFWVVARDGNGGFGSDETKITVDASSGPFRVTSPNTAVTIAAGTKKKIQWDVAKTNLSPVSASNVRILLSLDGGETFPKVLKDSTPNDGNEKIKIPNTPTAMARIRVEAKDNIFWDMSDTNFTIDGGFTFIGVWHMQFTGGSQLVTHITIREDGTITQCADPNGVNDCIDGNYTWDPDDNTTGQFVWFGGNFTYQVIDSNHVDAYDNTTHTLWAKFTRL